MNTSKNIAVIASFRKYSSKKAMIGGYLIRVFSLIKGLSKEFDLILFADDFPPELPGKIKKKVVPRLNFLPFLLRPFIQSIFVAKEVARNRISLILCETIYGMSIGFIVNRLLRIPIIYDMHGVPVEEGELEGVLKRGSLLRILADAINIIWIKCAKKVLVVSSMMKVYIQKRVNTQKICIIRNGVDLKMFFVREKLSKNSDSRTKICFLGNFRKYQGVEFLIRAFRDAYAKNKNLHLVLIDCESDTRKREKVMELIQELNMTNACTVFRNLNHSEIPDILKEMDVLVLPRPNNVVNEVAMPTKFPEYLSMGKLVLSTNVGEPALLLRRYNAGVVVENKDIVKNLSDGILKCVRLNDNGKKIMQRNARKVAEDFFDWTKINLGLSRIFQTILVD